MTQNQSKNPRTLEGFKTIGHGSFSQGNRDFHQSQQTYKAQIPQRNVKQGCQERERERNRTPEHELRALSTFRFIINAN